MPSRFATVKITARATNICFNGLVRATITSNMEPKTTPKAYNEIKWPAIGMEQFIDFATSGKIPIITYSVNPNPNVPSANGKRHDYFRITIPFFVV